MKIYIKIALLLVFMAFSLTSYAQKTSIPVVKFDQVQTLLNSSSDTVYVVNFWATWCAPCIKELPDFELIRKKYQDKKFRMLLISLDFSDKLEKRVIPFVERKKLGAEVWLLDEPDYNSWIDKVEPKWEGDIPITLIFKPSQKYRKLTNGETHAEALEKVIEPVIE